MAQPPMQPRFSTPPPAVPANWLPNAGIKPPGYYFVPNAIVQYPAYHGNPFPVRTPMFVGTPSGPPSAALSYAVSVAAHGSPSAASLIPVGASSSVTDVQKLKTKPVPESTETEESVFRKVAEHLFKSGPCSMFTLYQHLPLAAQRLIMENGSVKTFLATCPHFILDDGSKSVSLADTEETLAFVSSLTTVSPDFSPGQKAKSTSSARDIPASVARPVSGMVAAAVSAEPKLPAVSVSSVYVSSTAAERKTWVPPATTTSSRIVITNPSSGETVDLTRVAKSSVVITDSAGRPVTLPSNVKVKTPQISSTAPATPFSPSWLHAGTVETEGGADDSEQPDLGSQLARSLSAEMSDNVTKPFSFPASAKNSPQRFSASLHQILAENASLTATLKQRSTHQTPSSHEQRSAAAKLTENSVSGSVNLPASKSKSLASAAGKLSEHKPPAASVDPKEISIESSLYGSVCDEDQEEESSNVVKMDRVEDGSSVYSFAVGRSQLVACGDSEYDSADEAVSGGNDFTAGMASEDVDFVSLSASAEHLQPTHASNSRLRLDAPVFLSRSSSVGVRTDGSNSSINPYATEFVPTLSSSLSSVPKVSSGASVANASLGTKQQLSGQPPQRFVINCANDGDDSSSYDSHPDTPGSNRMRRKRSSASTPRDVQGGGGDMYYSEGIAASAQCCDVCVRGPTETQCAPCHQCLLGLDARGSGKSVSEAEYRELEVKAAMLLMLLTTSDPNEKQKLLEESCSALTSCRQHASKVAGTTSIPVSLETYDSVVKDTRRLLSVCRKPSVLVNAGKLASNSASLSSNGLVDDDSTATPRSKNRPHYIRPAELESSTNDDGESMPLSRASHNRKRTAASSVDNGADSSVTIESIGSKIGGGTADSKVDSLRPPSSHRAVDESSNVTDAATRDTMPTPVLSEPSPPLAVPTISSVGATNTVQKWLETIMLAQQQQQQMLQAQKQQQVWMAVQALGGPSAVMNDPALLALVQKMMADSSSAVANPMMSLGGVRPPLVNPMTNTLAAALAANPLLQSAVGARPLANSPANPLALNSGSSYLQSQMGVNLCGMDPNLLGMSSAGLMSGLGTSQPFGATSLPNLYAASQQQLPVAASPLAAATLQNLLGALPRQFSGTGLQNPPGFLQPSLAAAELPDVFASSQTVADAGLQPHVAAGLPQAVVDAASAKVLPNSLTSSSPLQLVPQTLIAELPDQLSTHVSPVATRACQYTVTPPLVPPPSSTPAADTKVSSIKQQTTAGKTSSPPPPAVAAATATALLGSDNNSLTRVSSVGDVNDLLQQTQVTMASAISSMTQLMNDLKVDNEHKSEVAQSSSGLVRSAPAAPLQSDLLLSISHVSLAQSNTYGGSDEDEAIVNSSDDEKRAARIMDDGFLTLLSETLKTATDSTVDKVQAPADKKATQVELEERDEAIEENFVLQSDAQAAGREGDEWEEEDAWSAGKWVLKETAQKTLNKPATSELSRSSGRSGASAADSKGKVGSCFPRSQPPTSETSIGQSYTTAKRHLTDVGPSASNATQFGTSGSQVRNNKAPLIGIPVSPSSWTLSAHVPENFKFGHLRPPGKSSIVRWDSDEPETVVSVQSGRPVVDWENVLPSIKTTAPTSNSVSASSSTSLRHNSGENSRASATATKLPANGRESEHSDGGSRSEGGPAVAKVKDKSKFERLIASLLAKHPSKTERDVHEALKSVRSARGGTLANVPMSSVLQEASEYLVALTPANPKPVAMVTDPAECCICADVISASQSQDQLDCGHSFHSKCIRRWLDTSRTCPVCRDLALLHDEFPSLSGTQSHFN